MKRYFYQIPFSEYRPGLIGYLNQKNSVKVKINNVYFYEYYRKVVEFYRKLNAYYDTYASRVREIVEKKMNIENVGELLKLELYLYNIVSIYQDQSIFSEDIPFEKVIDQWIHNIDEDTLCAYFNTRTDSEGLNDKKLFIGPFLKKSKLYAQWWIMDYKCSENDC
ncbi:MAG: hypothetical protein QHH06_07155 [Clostridiales bacterium]|nr:hypothetical protein [Eubacteriales bacterium]MDH7566245.1 hypothetical protein [Clostridiales bacterium]